MKYLSELLLNLPNLLDLNLNLSNNKIKNIGIRYLTLGIQKNFKKLLFLKLNLKNCILDDKGI